MNIRSLLMASLGLVSWGAIASAPSSAVDYAGLSDSLSDATVGVLSQLGYDCDTASVGGIICKKCQVEDNKQKCQAFVCDAVTKKCRKRSAEVPRIPGLGAEDEQDSNDGINLPSL